MALSKLVRTKKEPKKCIPLKSLKNEYLKTVSQNEKIHVKIHTCTYTDKVGGL